jgi:murein DD-endopeptidase MepM/ murein hydrolase activator NlpD
MRQLWTRAAVIALTAGTLAGCETASAPLYPAREGQAPGQPLRGPTPNFPIVQAPAQPVAPQDAPIDTARQPSEAIRAEPIPEPARPAPEVQSQALPPLAPAEPPPPPPPPPVQARPVPPVVVTTVTGPVVAVSGKPKIYVVKSGDALDAIARKLDTTRADLAKDNDLEAPYRLKLGQELKGPASKGKAYVVQTGDTLTAIAKRFNVTAAALADENDLKTGASIRKGQKLLLPEGFKDKGPIKTTVPGTAAPAQPVATTAAPRPTAPTRTAETVRAAPAAEPVAAEPEPAAVTTTTTSLSVTGAVVTVTGPRQVHTVKSGDTLSAIARRFDMSVSELAKDNKLEADQTLKLGQKIKGPATSAKAYVAQAGDTLTAIAKRFNVTPKALAAENDLKIAATLKKGQKIRLPDGFRDKGPVRTTTTTTRPAAASAAETPATATSDRPALTPAAPVPYTPAPRPVTPPATSYPRPTAPVAAQPVAPSAPVRPIIETSAAPTEAEIIASGRGKFAWPLRGEILSDFGIKGTGQRNDGLNIRAASGTPVMAAADGEVAYAGNQVPSFGNLVLVKHADGWVTAYAHLASSDVKMRQQVVKGQQLGTVGATGGVTEPQLHFEMRFAPTAKDKARPVDPNLVLPK